ncbi:MAG: beta-ketoacyl synthase N-terminal-like domain-containing protein [Parahaliea sp.]
MPIFSIRAAHSFSIPCIDEQVPPNIKAQLKAHCRESFRRIDLFTQLALLGSAQLVNGRMLAADTALYLSSRFGSLDSTVTVHERILQAGDLPKPVHFINTLSNVAGYYVARNLGLSGVNHFVSRDDASLLAALELARIGLVSGQISSALIGQVEEMPRPLNTHRQRLGIGSNFALVEDSHWLWIDVKQEADQKTLGLLDDVATVAGEAELKNWLAEQSRDAWLFVPDVASVGVEIRRQFRHLPLELPYSPGQSAAALIAYLQGSYTEPLLVIIPDNAGRYSVLSCHSA